ncbi:MAG: hypothetical protein P4L67_01795 [Candidatus Pacebacteria bacterium]|nr:hypothetical protein [Candidatus Paceibacterota bacterium]
MPHKTSVPPALFETYLAMIKNSPGSNLFRNAYFVIDGKKQDVLRDGDLSCAVYVSSVLRLTGLIPETHTTVKGTVEAMKKAGWRPIKKPRVGSVLVWGAKTFKKSGETHNHIGFSIGDDKAVSNNSKKRSPAIHHWTFGTAQGQPKRVVEAIYWNKKLG